MKSEINPKVEQIIKNVQKPLTYIACEDSAVYKNNAALSFCLVYPDIYELAIANLGINILYSVLNEKKDIWAQRAYMPDLDMIEELEKSDYPLFSLEEGRSLNDFDVVGFSMPHELSYPNILKILELSRIPIRRNDRADNDPIVIAGGHGAFNPASMSPFIDAFVIGDGEIAALEIAEKIIGKSNRSRNEKLEAISGIKGVWVPGLNKTVEKSTVVDLNEVCHDPLIPSSKGEKRHVVEIMRGCTAGCRFCQAGFINRPLREKKASKVFKEGLDGIASCGLKQLSLLSLSTSDYSQIEKIVEAFSDELKEKNVSISLPSLRMDDFAVEMLTKIAAIKKTGLTFAIEAGSQRLRDVINKNLDEEQIISTLSAVFEKGWSKVKLYFMIGLPTETQKDLDDIVRLIDRISVVAKENLPKKLKKKLKLNISVSNFVPKPHTPFQWARQDDLSAFKEKHRFLTSKIRGPHLNLRWHNAEQSDIEGLLARADEKIADVIERAYKKGALFNNFSERFDYDAWLESVKESGVDIEEYQNERSQEKSLPWDFVDCGVDKEFLKEESKKSLKGEDTADCRNEKCPKCGVCEAEIRNRLSDDFEYEPTKKQIVGDQEARKFRLVLEREGQFKYLSHLEWIALVERKLRQTGLRFVSKGKFNPRPKLSFSQALPLGFSSEYELADFTIKDNISESELCLMLQKVFAHAAKFKKLISSPEKMIFETATYHLKIKNGQDEGSIVKALAQAADDNKDKALKIEKRDRFLSIKLNECILKSEKSLADDLLKVTCPVGVRPDSLVKALAKDNAIVIEVKDVRKMALTGRSSNGK
ncbi:hypothetical protein LCGC14_0844980 [marine sediment metagenome]|uniref:Radical SAM core domain-containing protein n=1 Tax=marine sediment metagenome TaxID=412755 RepID=A0A0F9PC14_9ZZZZ